MTARRAAAAWAQRSAVADRIARGASLVARRRATALADWVRAGRRDDLTGWRAALGPLARLAVLAVAAWILYSLVRALPWLMWILVAIGLRVAWRAGKQTPVAGAGEDSVRASERSPEETREAIHTWVRAAIGERQGVHLRDLLTNAQQHHMFEGLEMADFRTHLERWEVPVRKRVRVRGLGVTVGIHRDDLPAPAGTPSEPLPEDGTQEPPDPRLHAA